MHTTQYEDDFYFSKQNNFSFQHHNLTEFIHINPIWPGARVNLTPPIVFCNNSKSIRAIWLFQFTQAPYFYTYCLSFQAYCLNALFYLHQTKSIFSPTSSHWISTFYSALESLLQKQANKGNLHIFSFSLIHVQGLKIFANVFAHLNLLGQELFKKYYFLQFAINIWIFANFTFFLQIIEVEPKGFPKT